MDIKKTEIDYGLCMVTDRELMTTATIEEAVEKAILGGVTMIQLREKSCSSLDFYNVAKKVKCITDRYKIPLIINDRIDIALAIHATGVHLGQNDMPAHIAREILGPDKILGISATNMHEAIEAQEASADYIGVGAMFHTGTKTDAVVVSMEELQNITQTIHIPVMIIGGINKTNILEFQDINIQGVAIVSAIIAQPDIEASAREFKERILDNILTIPNQL